MGDKPKIIETDQKTDPSAEPRLSDAPAKATEFGGPEGPEPTRYGDWEKKGRCIDF